jgi:transposase
VGVIDAILEDDKQKPAKQRHTARRSFDRLQAEHGFTGGYTTIKNYVHGAHVRGREMFVPLMHPAGEAQVDFPPHKRRPVCGTLDFGEALVIIAGVECKAHFLVMDLATPATKTCRRGPRYAPLGRLFRHSLPGRDDGGVSRRSPAIVRVFGAVPTRILYDNTRIAVAKILGGEQPRKTRAFSELQSYYLFPPRQAVFACWGGETNGQL